MRLGLAEVEAAELYPPVEEIATGLAGLCNCAEVLAAIVASGATSVRTVVSKGWLTVLPSCVPDAGSLTNCAVACESESVVAGTCGAEDCKKGSNQTGSAEPAFDELAIVELGLVEPEFVDELGSVELGLEELESGTASTATFPCPGTSGEEET